MEHIDSGHQGCRGQSLTTMPSSIITNERYVYIASIIKACYKKKNAGQAHRFR